MDFQEATVSGQLDNFTGFDMNADFIALDGTLIFYDGQVGAVNPNDLDAQIIGSLFGDGYVIDVDAFWEGHLKGTQSSAFLATPHPAKAFTP